MSNAVLHVTVAGDTLVIKNVDADGLRENIRAFFTENPLRLAGISNMSFIPTPEATKWSGLENFQKEFLEIFNQCIENILKRITPNEEDAFWGLLNVTDNMPDYLNWPDILSLKNIYRGMTGVVISTGPSLKLILPELKKHQESVIIFACDSAVRVLLEENITPDFVSTMERIGDCYHLFKDLPKMPATPLVGPSVIPQQGFNAWPGPKLRIAWEFGFEDWFSDVDLNVHLGASPSVSHLSYLGLRILGCEKIILAGQDLAFDPSSGKSHTDNVDTFLLQVGDDLQEINGKKTPVYDVTGYDGKPRRTTATWHHFATSFNQLIARYGGQVFHAIPENRGIPITHTTRIDPWGCLEKLAPIKPDKNLAMTKLNSLKPQSLFSPNITQCTQAALNDFRVTSLAAMREISAAWRDHDVRVADRDHKTYYENFFNGLESRLNNLKNSHNHFFEKKFLKLIMNSYLGRLIEKNQELHQNPDFISRTLNLIQNYFQTFNLIHLWASRALETIATRN